MFKLGLCFLASEVLEQIVEYLPASDVFMLWRTNRILQRVLASRAVTSISSKEICERMISYPSFVSHLVGLRKLDVALTWKQATGCTWRVLETLPPSLTFFRLASRDAFQLFYMCDSSPCPMKNGGVPWMNQFNTAFMLTGLEATKETIFDLSSVVPGLTTLILEGPVVSAGFALIPYLPDSITNLAILSTWYPPTPLRNPDASSSFFKFPSSLTALKLFPCHLFDEVASLPASVTHLNVDSSPNPQRLNSTTSPAPLPPHLISFCGAAPRFKHIISPESFLDASDHPRLTFFPSTLTSFSLGHSNTPRVITDLIVLLKVLAIQSPYLNSLDMPKSTLDNDSISHMPRQLKTLSFRASPTLTPAFARDLPRTLTKLKVNSDNRCRLDPNNSDWTYLPSGLIELWLGPLYCPEPEFITFLPKSITLFRTSYEFWLWRSQTILSHLPNVRLLNFQSPLGYGSSFTMPAGLTSLRLFDQPELGDDFFARLPHGLETLLCEPFTSIRDKVGALLPRTLTTLHVKNDMRARDVRKFSLETFLSALPPLTELQLGHFAALGAQDGRALPPTLLRLQLMACAWTDDEFRSFTMDQAVADHEQAGYVENGLRLQAGEGEARNEPPRLQSLGNLKNLRFLKIRSAPKLSDACFAHLPRQLELFEVSRDRSFTPAIFDHCLPPYLVDLRFPKNLNFYRHHFHLLPHGIRLVSRRLRISRIPGIVVSPWP